MHIIREEIDAGLEEQDDDLAPMPAGSADAGASHAPGGLSRALRPGFGAPPPWARAQSLRNLLDQDLVDSANAAMGLMTPPPLQPLPAVVAASQQQQQQREQKRSSFEEAQRRGGKTQQWDRKQEVSRSLVQAGDCCVLIDCNLPLRPSSLLTR